MAKKKTIAPVYLLVADETPEFTTALKHAAKLAEQSKADIAVLHVMEREELQILGGIQTIIHEELVEKAQALLDKAAKDIKALTGKTPLTYLEEGGRYGVIIDVINRNPSISKLILGGGTQTNSPGPLVSYFTHKGLSKLRVPLTIIPESMDALEDK